MRSRKSAKRHSPWHRTGLPFVLITLVPMLATAAYADATLSLKVGGDDIARPHRVDDNAVCEPCVPPPRPGDAITEYVAPGRARRDRGPMSIILDTHAGKVDFLCDATHRYSELAYPVKYDKLPTTDFQRRLGDMVDFQVTAPATKTPGQVKQWKVDVFETTIANGLREQFRIQVAVAGSLPDADGPLLGLLEILHEVLHHGHGWSRFIPFTTGVPIVWEERERQPETEFVYREEVVKIDSGELQAVRFRIPEGYTRVPYDPVCMPAR